MRALIATWPRRLTLTAMVFALAFALGALWLRYVNDSNPANNPTTDADLMKYLLTLPALLAAVVMMV